MPRKKKLKVETLTFAEPGEVVEFEVVARFGACGTCAGTGEVAKEKPFFASDQVEMVECPICKGSGLIIKGGE